MRLFVSGSAPLLASDHEAFQARTGHAILERYGMTETGMNTTNPYEGGPRKPGTVGKPLPGIEIRVVERETGRVLPDGEVGIVEVRGPNVFAGYWQMPEKTAAEFRADGYFITGDLGRIDEDGYLSIVGRDKDLVISGGYNIYPKEIEELLDAHPAVLESAVIGVPHPDFGETVVAVVVAGAGTATPGRGAAGLRRRRPRPVQTATSGSRRRGAAPQRHGEGAESRTAPALRRLVRLRGWVIRGQSDRPALRLSVRRRHHLSYLQLSLPIRPLRCARPNGRSTTCSRRSVTTRMSSPPARPPISTRCARHRLGKYPVRIYTAI